MSKYDEYKAMRRQIECETDAEIAFGTRDVDLLDLAREHHPLGRNQVEAKRVRHATSSTQVHAASASFLPFSTACSIVPTM